MQSIFQPQKLYISVCYILYQNMAQTQVLLNEHEDRVISIVKGKYGLKSKEAAIKFVIDRFEEELLEPELRPEYIEKLQHKEKSGKLRAYTSLDKLRSEIENA